MTCEHIFFGGKKGDIFQNEKKWTLFFAISLMSGLIEDSWTLIFASAFSLLQDHMPLGF